MWLRSLVLGRGWSSCLSLTSEAPTGPGEGGKGDRVNPGPEALTSRRMMGSAEKRSALLYYALLLGEKSRGGGLGEGVGSGSHRIGGLADDGKRLDL